MEQIVELNQNFQVISYALNELCDDACNAFKCLALLFIYTGAACICAVTQGNFFSQLGR